MKKLIFAIALALLTFMAALVFSAQRPEPINGLYVFGDSLSDTGTVFRATGGMYPPAPYFQGRYSNGRVWVEYLADRLQLSGTQINNFAAGGATTGGDRNNLVPGLLLQVRSFAQSQQQANPNALYVLWAGANDYLQGVNRTEVPVGNVTQAIAALQQVGAKKILVANLPDLGQLPSTRSSTQASPLSGLTQAHNQNLRRSLKVLTQQQPDLKIATLDANTLYREAVSNPAKFGFTNVTGTCLSGSSICSNPNQYLFWDGIHPTTAAHRILGEAAFSALQDTGIVNMASISRP